MNDSNHPNTIATVHMFLQGNGGVGKSLAAGILAQYLAARGNTIRCIDADPVNRTLHGYAALPVMPLELLCDGAIDQRGFDRLVEELVTGDGPFVVDGGASTFIPLRQYMLENDVPGMLRGAGRRLCMHAVLAGGPGLADTVNGFAQVAAATPEKGVVVWVNEFFGSMGSQAMRFHDMKGYQDHADKIAGWVTIPHHSPETFGRDLEEVLRRKLTFGEAIGNSGFSLLSKRRLNMLRHELFTQLDALGLD